MPTLDEVADALYAHYPDFISGRCQCGTETPVYQLWIDHVMRALEPPEGQADNGSH